MLHLLLHLVSHVILNTHFNYVYENNINHHDQITINGF